MTTVPAASMLAAATTVPAANMLPRATIAVLATITVPPTSVAPTISALVTSPVPGASLEPAAIALPPLRLLVATISVLDGSLVPVSKASSFTKLPAATKVPAARTLPRAIVVAPARNEFAAMGESSVRTSRWSIAPFNVLPAVSTVPACRTLPGATTIALPTFASPAIMSRPTALTPPVISTTLWGPSPGSACTGTGNDETLSNTPSRPVPADLPNKLLIPFIVILLRSVLDRPFVPDPNRTGRSVETHRTAQQAGRTRPSVSARPQRGRQGRLNRDATAEIGSMRRARSGLRSLCLQGGGQSFA